ncbi:MAG: PEP/pyruvate-binding domain-containing protein, partial [Pseudomonadota bacterium]
MEDYVIEFDALGMGDVERVGGKNASLGEMISNLGPLGVTVPGGFATTAAAYRDFLAQDGLDARINVALDALDTNDVTALAETGARIRSWVLQAPLPERLTRELRQHYDALVGDDDQLSVAVRSSATAEDLPDASFAGQQETFLNVSGFDNVVRAMHEVFASLFNDRAISYREHQGFEHSQVALSAGIQRMVRSDCGASGVMFTLDTESGFPDVVFVTAAWGLGETVVQGAVNPDEFYLYKPSLTANRPAVLRKNLGAKAIKMVYDPDTATPDPVKTVDVDTADRGRFSLSDEQATELARQAVTIEKHYGRHMDIEWGLDGVDGHLYILQARPETVNSRSQSQVLERYQLNQHATVISSGRSRCCGP